MTEFFSFPLTAASVPFCADLGRVDSTNSVLSRLNNPTGYSVVLTTDQTAGRGRRERQWVSRPRESLALSVLIPRARHLLAVDSWVPLLVGVAVVAALTELGLGDAGLKWPNDVLVRGKKLAGILCEVLPQGDVVASLGINLRFVGPPPTPQAISLDETMTFGHDTPDIFASTFLAHLRELMVAEPEEKRRRVEAVTVTIGRKVQILEPSSGTWAGFAESLDEEGHLVVIDEAGERHALAAADIEHLYQ